MQTRFLRKGMVATVLLLGLSACIRLDRRPGPEELDGIRAQLQEFQALCYEKARERIYRTAYDAKTIVISPSSKVVGAWEFELFFGRTRPSKWAGIPVLSSADGIRTEGAYELRYTYLQEERTAMGSPILFRGVHQQVFDLHNTELIAERVNYIGGNDFNRSAPCLSARGMFPWYEGNNSFADRVLGHRFADSEKTRRANISPERRIKAALKTQEKVRIELEQQSSREIQVNGVYYYLGQDEIPARVQPGRVPGIVAYLRNPPYAIISMIEREDDYFLVILPHGPVRNRPPIEVLFLYLNKDFKEIQRVYAQIPPGIYWSDGWGINPKEVTVSTKSIDFTMYGEKRRTSEYSDQRNEGQYLKRYRLNVRLAE